DDEMDVEADEEEEEEEHPAPADSVVVAPTAADRPHLRRRRSHLRLMSSQLHHHHTLHIVRQLGFLFQLQYLCQHGLIQRKDRPDVTLPPRKRLDIALGPRYEVGESSSAAAARPAGGAPVSTDTELGGYVREFEMRVRQDTDEIYMRLDDEQTERQLLAGRLNMLFRDRRAHAYTRQLMETEARMSREAWMSKIKELQATDRRRQTVISELLRIDHRRSTEISELRTALQGQGLVGDPTQSELPEEAGGSA
nr:hypothetical protein [Tanacetum cinerariifolium]